MRGFAAVALVIAVVVGAGGCGDERQDADEPEGDFTLEIVNASFPARQTLAERSTMRIGVRNTDDRELPNLAVTVKTEAGQHGQAATAFGQASDDIRLSDPNRPVWIVDREPEGGQTAYTNTWALGRMLPGETKEFEWRLTAVRPGSYTIDYSVAPGLNGKAKVARGQKPTGLFHVTISAQSVPARVNAKGEVVREPAGE